MNKSNEVTTAKAKEKLLDYGITNYNAQKSSIDESLETVQEVGLSLTPEHQTFRAWITEGHLFWCQINRGAKTPSAMNSTLTHFQPSAEIETLIRLANPYTIEEEKVLVGETGVNRALMGLEIQKLRGAHDGLVVDK